MKTVLFVDIDGVFHSMSDRHFEYVGNSLVVADDTGLFQWAPLLWPIIEPYEVDLVVHSSWRKIYPIQEIVSRFPHAMQHRIIAATQGRERYQSILEYVDLYEVDRFAVLDDMPEDFPAA